MPYIDVADRVNIDAEIDALIHHAKKNPSGKLGGVLNYTICRLAMGILEPEGYTDTSNMLGHVSSAEAEMRRRLLAPYEDKCIEKNGDLDEFSK